eukprot:TRINITY_DN17664_c0_g1_i1.p1 TRINITY_DN17664_c0_g1~~TRINITY_DN17664_c0_g1_i1.p1  ORF type:complete len:179 (-),score=56.15 TRINITY_DN17664_c0_g1_i1:421-957(-)
MASFMFESDGDMAPFSPASSVSMSVGSDPSPVPSPASPHTPDHSQHYPRYQNIYEERLQPLQISKTEARPMPQPTHQVSYNPSLQARFNNALQNQDYRELQDLLDTSSDDIDINKYNQDGQTPIQQACISGQLAMVQLMIRYGADPNMRSRDGWATLHLASFYGNSEILQYIILCSKR